MAPVRFVSEMSCSRSNRKSRFSSVWAKFKFLGRFFPRRYHLTTSPGPKPLLWLIVILWCLHNHMLQAFNKLLASEQSRDITFTALVPSFHIQTLSSTQTLTLTNTPNHTLTRSQTLTRPRNATWSKLQLLQMLPEASCCYLNIKHATWTWSMLQWLLSDNKRFLSEFKSACTKQLHEACATANTISKLIVLVAPSLRLRVGNNQTSISVR